jgi:hypothetical protein
MDPTEAAAMLKSAVRTACDEKEVPPFLSDDDLYKFAACRRFDMTSAAQRYIRFMQLFHEYDLSFDETPEVSKGLGLSVFSINHFDTKGHPLVFGAVRNIDWRKISARDMQKTWFYCVWKALSSSPLAQSQGIVLVLMGNGISVSIFNLEFHGFIAKAVQECMPMKVARLFVLNQPWFFSRLIWPLISQLMSAKIRQRVVMVGKNYDLMQEYVPFEAIPHELRPVPTQQEDVLETSDPDRAIEPD